ncbi:hypothetical protein [Cupriavidus sp. TMH.W2]|uniref:hypothetical protein n=1 Tax=Cupriavidus sp. TMH.W2 TaxID=3434465 RepID=UPI003D782D97
MPTVFAWYAIHKDTKHIVAGFNDHHDADKFCSAFAHAQYVVRDRATVEAIHDPL